MFIVVLSILLVDTIVTMGPLIFLGMGQKYTGEIDGVFSPPVPGVGSVGAYETYHSKGMYLNWTQIEQQDQGENNLAPRKQIWGYGFTNDQTLDKRYGHEVTLMKTELEKSIDLGVAWPFGTL